MSTKRAVRAAAIAATISMSALTLSSGPAFADPTQPPCPNCNGGTHPGGPAGGPSHEPQEPQSHGPQSHGPQSPQSSAPQSPQTHEPQSPQSSAPPSPQSSAPPSSHGPASSAPPSAPSETPSSAPSSPPSSAPGSPPSSEPSRKPLAAPSTQPPHPAYVPHGEYVRGTVDVGGPTDARAGFSVVGHGAPPPPPERGWGWNDGPPPGAPPPNWQGPPPQGGWGGPPPPGGWNRRWDAGPPRDVVVAQVDFGPFAYNSYMVIPTFNWMFGGWGYWYFGVWVPLY